MAGRSQEVDDFAVCLFKYREGQRDQARHFVHKFMDVARKLEGAVHVWSDDPKSWEFLAGRDHFAEPNHLSPAIFDFSCLVVCGFCSMEEVQTWWSADEVFELLKKRACIEKMGVFIVPGLQQSTDLLERNRFIFADRLLLFEFLKVDSFKPMRAYADGYKHGFEYHKMKKNLLFADAASGVLMNEYPLDFACLSTWRSKQEAQNWCESEQYRRELAPLREEYAKCLALLVPLFEERLDDLIKAKKSLAVAEQLAKVSHAKEH